MPATDQVVQYLCQVGDKPDILFCRYFFKESLNKNVERIVFSSNLFFYCYLNTDVQVEKEGRFSRCRELFPILNAAEYLKKKTRQPAKSVNRRSESFLNTASAQIR